MFNYLNSIVNSCSIIKLENVLFFELPFIYALIDKIKPTIGVGCLEIVMDIEKIKIALNTAHHELTTLHNLSVSDNPKISDSWQTDTSEVTQLIDEALTELCDI